MAAEAGAAYGSAPGSRLDAESAEWVRTLGNTGREQRAALIRLHELLLHIARSEVRRRAISIQISGPECDDLASQAADDALMAITGKLATFHGESRFTTWAYRFVILEVSSKIGRHFWRRPGISFEAEDWDRLPDRFGLHPAREAERRDLVDAIRRAIDEELTDRQRQVFVALVLNAVPLDALVIEFGTSRNAIYKAMFDARRKLRTSLVARGYLDEAVSGEDSGRS